MTVYAFRSLRFVVSKDSGRVYVVDPEIPACSCPYFLIEGKPCKHIIETAVAERVGNVIQADERSFLILLRRLFLGST